MLVTRMTASTPSMPPSPGPPPSESLPPPPPSASNGIHGSYQSVSSSSSNPHHHPPSARASPSTTTSSSLGRSPISASHPANQEESMRRRQEQSQLSRDSAFGAAGGSLSARHQSGSPFAHQDSSFNTSSNSNYQQQQQQPTSSSHPRSYSSGSSSHPPSHRSNSPPPPPHPHSSSSSNATASSSRRPPPQDPMSSSSSTNTHSHSSRSAAASSSNNPPHVRSKHLLSHALELAQRAVDLDQAMRFPEALALYKETVLRLGEVMARVAATEKRRLEREGGGAGAGGANQDEGRSLREIHDAYRARIALLETEIPPSPTPTITQESSPVEDPDSGFNGVGSAILSLYQRTDPSSPSSSQGRRTPRPTAPSSPGHFDDTPTNGSTTNGLRRTDSTSSNGSSKSHSRTMSLQTAPSVNVEQPTPRPRASSRPVYRSPLPPPAAPPPAPPPLPTNNRFSINQTQGFTVSSHSTHSSISSLTNGADPSASSGSQPPTPSTYGGYPVSRHSPPTENGSPLDQEHAAQVRRQSLLESLRAGEEDGGITSFGSMSKSTSDRSLVGSFRQQGNHLEGVRERPESGGVLPSANGRTSFPRNSEDTERGMEVLSRTPLQPGFIMDSPVTPANPSTAVDSDFSPRPSSARASIDSGRSNDSRGSRLGRSIKAAVSPRASLDEPLPPRSAVVPNTANSDATARERDSLVSPRTITGSTGALLVSSADDKPFRISATDEGTISQRRRGGPPSLNENTFVPPSSASNMSRDSSAQSSFYPSSDASLRAETLPIQRSSSAEPRSPPDGSRTTSEFGVGAGVVPGVASTVGAAGGGGSQSRGSSIFSSTRLRALSQPGRRPSPSSVNGEAPRQAAAPPPVLRSISRKASFPSQQPISGLPPTSSPSPFAMGRAPSVSTTNSSLDPSRTLHNRLNPPPSLTIQRSVSNSSTLAPRTASSISHSNGGGLAPSQSILLAAGKHHTGLHSPQPPLAPQDLLHRPFHLMGLLRLTMYDAGAYLTRKLFVGSEVWSQGGSKLLHLDTKIQVLQGLSFHLEALESLGFSLLPASKDEDGDGGGGKSGKGGKSPSAGQVGVEFARMLEEFEGVMDLSRTTLEKKVGSLGPMKPKARGAASLAAWGSKLSRSFDRMANGKNDGSLKAYVDAIEMICIHAQTIDLHLEYFTSPPPTLTSSAPSSPYAQLPEQTRNMIKTRLTSASQFFGQVVVTILLRDLMILLEKHGKMYGKFIEGP